MKEEVVKKNQILLMDGRNEYEYDEIDESTCPENVHASSTFDTVSSMNHFESNHGNSSSGSPTCDFSSPQKHPNEEAHVGNTFTCLRHDDVYRKIGSIQGAKHHELQQEKEHIKSMTSDSKEASSHLKTPEEKQRHYSLVEMLFSFLSFLVSSVLVILKQLQTISPLGFDAFQRNSMLTMETTEELTRKQQHSAFIDSSNTSIRSDHDISSNFRSTTTNAASGRKSSLVLFIDDSNPPLITHNESTEFHPPTLSKKLSISLLEIDNSNSSNATQCATTLNQPLPSLEKVSPRKSVSKSPTLSKIPSYTGRSISPDLDPEQLYKHQRDEMIYLKHHLNCFKFPQIYDEEE